jgi:hypothetical protein
MANHVDQFCADICVTLSIIDATVVRVETLIEDKAKSTEQDVRERMAVVEKRIEQGRAKVAAARAALERWTVDESPEASMKVAEWKTKRDTSKLHAHADRHEARAAAVIDVAVAAMDDAERAVLGALLARKEAISIQVRQAERP